MTDGKPTLDREELFAHAYVVLRDATAAARQAGYSETTATSNSYKLLERPRVKEYIDEIEARLRNELMSETIATKQEVQKVLTEIIRARFSDYPDLETLKPEQMTSAGLGKYKVTEFSGGKDGRATSRTVQIELKDKVAAIAELSKLKNWYQTGVNVNIDKRQLNVFVMDKDTQHMMGQIQERTGKLIGGFSDDQDIQGDTGSVGEGSPESQE